MQIIECKQGTVPWFMAKRGIASASNSNRVMTAKTMKPSAQQFDYACELVADRLLVGPAEWLRESHESDAMAHGKVMEDEARKWYAFEEDCDGEEAGFILSDCGRWGCSPDWLRPAAKRGLEIKCPKLSTHIRWLVEGGLPDEHRGQVHWSMIVTGYDNWDFVSYSRGLPPLMVHVERDEFTAKLAETMEGFWKVYSDLWDRVSGHVPPPPPPTVLDFGVLGTVENPELVSPW